MTKTSFALVVAAVAAACTDLSAPRMVARPRLATSQDTTGAPYLQADSTRLVVASAAFTSPQAVSAAAASFGVQVDSTTSMIQAPAHWLIHLANATSATAVANAVRGLKADARFTFVSTAYRTIQGQHDFVPLDRLSVIFKPGVTQAQIDSLNASLRTHIIRPPKPEWGIRDYWLAYPTDSLSDFLAVAAAYRRSPLVLLEEPDRITDYQLSSVPNDPYFSLQYNIASGSTLNGIRVDDNVEPAWDSTLGAGIVVAVVDAGVQASHEDFAHVACGYDAYRTQGPDVCPCPDCSVSPIYYHGTAAAGIIGATQNNNLGISGIAPQATIIPIRIFHDTSQYGQASAAQIAAAIDWAYSVAHADVISMEWQGSIEDTMDSQAVVDAMNLGRNGKGTLVVASAGNQPNNTLPPTWQATIPGVLSVGAIDASGSITHYTPSTADVVAPSGDYTGCAGGTLVTLDLMGAGSCANGPGGNKNYLLFTGTSATAPQVAGVAALLYAISPSLTASQARTRIINAADWWGIGTQTGNGKVNAWFTLYPLEVSVSGPTSIGTAGTYTWTANATDGTGTYTYQWQYSNDGGYSWTQLGTGQTQSRYVDSTTPDFLIQSTVNSGVLSRSSSPARCCAVTWASIRSVGLSGPTSVGTNWQCSWTGSVAGGTPPFIYSWKDSWDGASQVDTTSASSDTFTDDTPDAAEQYEIDLNVSDAYPSSEFNQIFVSSYGSGCGP